MGFLTPWFLAGLAMVGLPVWLHLLRKHRSTPRPFSSLMFFERRTQSSVRHRRLHYLLLFALRTALLVLMALAFASPYWRTRAAPATGSGGLLVLAIDQSFSMREGDRLARAKREAVAQLRPGRRAEIVAFANEAHLLTQPTLDVAALRGAIASVEPTDSRGSYGELARTLRVIADSAREPLEVHLFSDLQKSSMPTAFTDLRLPAGARLVLHAAAEAAAPNWAVEGVVAPRRIYGPDKVRVQATIAGFVTPAALRRASLLLNGRVLETEEASVAANGRATVEFANLDAPHGLNRSEVRIDSADGLAADDHYFFAIERADRRAALFISSGDSRDLLYFRAALEASANAAFRLDGVRAQATANVDPSRFAFVVLSDAGSLPRSFEEALKRYVRAGGSVWMALGPVAAARRSVPLLEGATIEGRYYARDADRFQTVSQADTAHPSMRRANGWQGVRFYHAVRVEAPNLKTVARLGDGTPILLEAAYGDGRILVFGSTFDGLACDFPLRTSFVPFVDQTARYLGGLDDERADFTVDSYLQVRAARERGVAVEVVDPQGRRSLSLEQAATAESVPLDREGFFEVHRSNGRHELVAVNADRRESDLSLISSETLALWEKSEPSGVASGGTERGDARRSLWPYVLALALLVAVAESLAGNRHLSERGATRNESHKEVAA